MTEEDEEAIARFEGEGGLMLDVKQQPDRNSWSLEMKSCVDVKQ